MSGRRRADDRGRRSLGLDDAYGVETPDDNRALYRDWAATYEEDFITPRGYVYHEHVAGLFAAARGTGSGPVLDVGCGTGIVGAALAARGCAPIDGLDLSPEMLARARAKGVYRELIEADLTQPVPIDDGTYMGIVSVGTFTHGHVGPQALHELVRIAAPGARFALGINAEHYDDRGFASVLNTLVDTGALTDLRFEQVRIYTTAEDAHANDLALVALATR